MKREQTRIGLRSVFVRCVAIAAFSTIVVAGVLSLQSARVIGEFAVSGVVSEAAKTVEARALDLAKPIRFKAIPKVEETAKNIISSAGASGSKLLVLNFEGAVLAESGPADDLRAALSELAAATLETGQPGSLKDGLWRAEPVFSAPGGAVIGVLAMAWNADAALAAAHRQGLVILASAAVVFLVMQVLALWLFQKVLGGPMRAIATSVSRISEGNLDSLETLPERRDEFGKIGRHLSSMVQSLAAADQAEQERRQEAEVQQQVVVALSTQLTRLSEGDLTAQIHEVFPERYTALRSDFNSSIANLSATIGQVVQATQRIKEGVNEIASASDDLSHRTESQAATLEETAAALDELTASVKSAAEGARDVEHTMAGAHKQAETNQEIVSDAVEAMNEIEASSKHISQIIGVIDDIAFQTNLLALNAGVEAARAGESGRGFAVVASEVRSLAQRSSEAAMEIKNLISESSQQVEVGVDLVAKAGEALSAIIGQVSQISGQISNIAEGADEQSIGLTEINTGVTQLDSVTQQNAAMAEQATAAGQTLSNDTEQLAALVAQFKLPEQVPASNQIAAE